VDNYESDSTFLAGKYDGARASEVTENKSSRRGRCLIEPPARFDGISVHISECSRYVTEAIVPGTRSCGIEIPYSRDTCSKLFRPRHLLPHRSSFPYLIETSIGLRCVGEEFSKTNARLPTGPCGFSRHS